ncbi:MAG: hypothetical protein GF392_00755, partial [Candidatus Omnitrophica bacterium]|nr:hypothetical protein [Candidatus Omnitrophota bacterium]
MKLRKNKFIKTIALLLVFTLIFQEIAGAEGFSFLTRKSDLQPQYFSGPINNPVLQHESYIKFTLKYILEDVVRDIDSCKRRIFDHRLVPGMGFVFDFRKDPRNDHDGKRKENGNWVIPCAVGDTGAIRQKHVYQWPYEAIVNEGKEVLYIRKRGEKREPPADVAPQPDISEKARTIRQRFLKIVLDNGRVLSATEAAAILEAARSWDSHQAGEWNVPDEVMA